MPYTVILRRAGLGALALALVAAPLAAADRNKPEAAAAQKPAKPVKGKLFAIVLGPGPNTVATGQG
jgi:hypothetical protein